MVGRQGGGRAGSTVVGPSQWWSLAGSGPLWGNQEKVVAGLGHVGAAGGLGVWGLGWWRAAFSVEAAGHPGPHLGASKSSPEYQNFSLSLPKDKDVALSY